MARTPGRGAATAPRTGRTSRVVIALVLAIVVLSGVVRLVDLGRFPDIVFDEHYYVHDARVILEGRLDGSAAQPWKPEALRSAAHPDLAKLAIAAGIAALGDGPWGWRVPSALAGTALIGLVFPLARRLGLSPRWSLAALLLVASDPMLVVESRLGVLDMFVALFTALAVYAALRAAQRGASGGWLLVCGAAIGAAFASKWSGGLAAIAVLVVVAPRVRWRHVQPSAAWRGGVALVAVPLGLYLATYAPYVAAGHGVADWLRLQAHMATFGWNVHGDASFASAPVTWPFDVHPIWFRWLVDETGTVGLLAIGNPLLWWGASAATVVLAVFAVTRRDAAVARPLLLVAALYLPWLLTSRQTYIYYMVPVIPFLGVVLAVALSRIAGAVKRGPLAATALCVITVAAGLLYFPFALGLPVPYEYYDTLMLFTTWR